MTKKSAFSKSGFTLIELLIVLAIIGILLSIGFASLKKAQESARDTERKSELRSVAAALEQFYSDNNRYPTADSGLISDAACGGDLEWGTGDFTCNGRTYLNQLPQDPLDGAGRTYTYIVNATGQVYCLTADLEKNPTTSTCPADSSTGHELLVTPRD